MNPNLDRLQPYPFQRIAELKQGISGNPEFEHLALSLGEPKHAPPQFVVDILSAANDLARDLATYPATRGTQALREAIAAWISGRFDAHLDPETQILPVSGTREALFSIGQAVLSGSPAAIAMLPNPFYQIYEGAALLGNATPYYVNCERSNAYQPDFLSVPDDVWRRCEIVYVCSPGNPTGALLTDESWTWLLDRADRYDFVLVADECYSEIYPDESSPPVGLLQIAARQGRADYARCLAFHSLSKRSNLPGLRSGFVAGDADIIARYFNYRTYQGCALPEHTQRASIAAWADESHVVENRAAYRRKFQAVTPILEAVLPVSDPGGGFYHWLYVGEDDVEFTRSLFSACNITVVPGSFLARPANGKNPGTGHVRVAWVAPELDCIEAASRIVRWIDERHDSR